MGWRQWGCFGLPCGEVPQFDCVHVPLIAIGLDLWALFSGKQSIIHGIFAKGSKATQMFAHAICTVTAAAKPFFAPLGPLGASRLARAMELVKLTPDEKVEELKHLFKPIRVRVTAALNCTQI